MWAPTAVHGGFSADLVTEIKRAVTIPVITVGRFTEPQYAELLVREGRTDLVAFGRQEPGRSGDAEKGSGRTAGGYDPMHCVSSGLCPKHVSGKTAVLSDKPVPRP